MSHFGCEQRDEVLEIANFVAVPVQIGHSYRFFKRRRPPGNHLDISRQIGWRNSGRCSSHPDITCRMASLMPSASPKRSTHPAATLRVDRVLDRAPSHGARMPSNGAREDQILQAYSDFRVVRLWEIT